MQSSERSSGPDGIACPGRIRFGGQVQSPVERLEQQASLGGGRFLLRRLGLRRRRRGVGAAGRIGLGIGIAQVFHSGLIPGVARGAMRGRGGLGRFVDHQLHDDEGLAWAEGLLLLPPTGGAARLGKAVATGPALSLLLRRGHFVGELLPHRHGLALGSLRRLLLGVADVLVYDLACLRRCGGRLRGGGVLVLAAGLGRRIAGL